MILRLSRYALCGVLAASLGCQNPSNRSNKFADEETFGARLSYASDDLAGLETGRGHLPSLASEMADHRRQAEEDRSPEIPGGSNLTVKRLLERGHDADAHGRTQEAKMHYQQVLVEDPDQPDAHHRLAILADRAGTFPLAERHYLEALRGKPHDADVLNDLGYSYFLQGRAADSERYLNQARQINPRHPHVSENLSLLYDSAKAEQVLLTVMGPRQTQATLAQLFENPPVAERFQPMPPMQGGGTNLADQQPHQPTEEPPSGLGSLQRKMEEARLRSIAERQHRKAPSHQAAVSSQSAGLPPLPPNYPRHVPAKMAYSQPDEIPDGRINDAFRSIDGQGHSLRSSGQYDMPRQNAPSAMAPPYEPRRLADTEALPLTNSRHLPEERAAAPTWNTPPKPWPTHSLETVSAETIEQANYTPAPPNYPPAGSVRTGLPTAAQRAAEIGMAAGPGSLFPPITDSYDSTQSQHGPAPAMRSLPGTNSRMNGSMYPEPGGQGVPADWNTKAPAQNPSGSWGQPPVSWNGPPHQTGRNGSPDGYTQDAYDQMRAQHNAQFNHDQLALAAQPGLLTNGPPEREDLPTSFDPSQQNWPAYTREQYDTRQMDQPTAEAPASSPGHGQSSGQTVPQYNPATQQAPQNYGRSW